MVTFGDKYYLVDELFCIGVIRLDFEDPYHLGNNLYSPIYFDHLRILSYPSVLSTLMSYLRKIINQRSSGLPRRYDVLAGFDDSEAITAAIGYMLVKPTIFVQKELSYKCNWVMLAVLVGSTVAHEDRIFRAVSVLRDSNCNVSDLVVIFDYQVIDGKDLTNHGLSTSAVLCLDDVVRYLSDERKIYSVKALESLAEYAQDPIAWSAKRGGRRNAY